MKRKWTLLTVCLALGLCPLAQAEVAGRGGQLDHRVQVATYSADNVFRIYTMKDRISAIQLGPGETINMDTGAMVVGKPGDQNNHEWIIGANKAGTMILIKPSEYATNPETNVFISTNLRTYLIELKLTDKASLMTYLLRFDYPQPPKPAETPFKGRELNVDPCQGTTNVNRRYRKRGDMTLSPSEVWDNGTFTCMRFPTNAPRPAIYQVLPDGTETLINSHAVNDIEVIHAVSKAFRLRMNNLVLELRTDANNTGWYNYSGTTNGQILEVRKDGSQ
ncbi:TrbG/VirB9 family P-type conjugative transfer protein [Rahnella perminowiae]|uniref:TrbG/VirB9 family P-type conjugative transfer protein n=1 Tax=Rahnella perminowiae TaxID=2816244 RepID=UPI00215BC4EE|nr:TrbG/VirB9 family P-type conjugative transfer protein [Rahnella perminowiae]MCR8998686.1 TrbG/VirB9 family P-type conjugative transfer protein [Rahnella perminowiae]MCR8998744.1 TrbG/VirB9 family P-type conjugative transfer protein [Rahnella perminowiae]